MSGDRVAHAGRPAHLDVGDRGARVRRGARGAALTMGALVSTALLVLAGYLFYTFRDINSGVRRVRVVLGKPPTHSVKVDRKDQNILLVGNDDRSNLTNREVRELKVGRDGGSLNTDTMLIVHVPADGRRATLISLPRDSWVRIKGYGRGKLNSAYSDAYRATAGSFDDKQLAGADSLIDRSAI